MVIPFVPANPSEIGDFQVAAESWRTNAREARIPPPPSPSGSKNFDDETKRMHAEITVFAVTHAQTFHLIY